MEPYTVGIITDLRPPQFRWPHTLKHFDARHAIFFSMPSPRFPTDFETADRRFSFHPNCARIGCPDPRGGLTRRLSVASPATDGLVGRLLTGGRASVLI